MDKGIWAVVRGMFQLVKSQRVLIHGLAKSHYGLVDALSGTGSQTTVGRPVEAPIDAEVIAKADAGIQGVERMFKPGES